MSRTESESATSRSGVLVEGAAIVVVSQRQGLTPDFSRRMTGLFQNALHERVDYRRRADYFISLARNEIKAIREAIRERRDHAPLRASAGVS